LAKGPVQKALAILAALIVWQAAAELVGIDFLLASPLQVAARLATIWRESGFWSTVAFSMSRIVGGFMTAFILGIVLALLAGRFPLVETFLWPYVVTIRSVPVASFIIISLIWLTGRQLAVFISFLMVFPMIYANVLQGIKSADGRLLEMTALYRVPWTRRLLYVYAPNVQPYLTSACSVALGTAWKAGVAAEVIGVVDGSIGEKLYESKIYFMTADLLAWTVIIVLISVLFEKLFLFLMKKAFAGMEKL